MSSAVVTLAARPTLFHFETLKLRLSFESQLLSVAFWQIGNIQNTLSRQQKIHTRYLNNEVTSNSVKTGGIR